MQAELGTQYSEYVYRTYTCSNTCILNLFSCLTVIESLEQVRNFSKQLYLFCQEYLKNILQVMNFKLHCVD